MTFRFDWVAAARIISHAISVLSLLTITSGALLLVPGEARADCPLDIVPATMIQTAATCSLTTAPLVAPGFCSMTTWSVSDNGALTFWQLPATQLPGPGAPIVQVTLLGSAPDTVTVTVTSAGNSSVAAIDIAADGTCSIVAPEVLGVVVRQGSRVYVRSLSPALARKVAREMGRTAGEGR